MEPDLTDEELRELTRRKKEGSDRNNGHREKLSVRSAVPRGSKKSMRSGKGRGRRQGNTLREKNKGKILEE